MPKRIIESDTPHYINIRLNDGKYPYSLDFSRGSFIVLKRNFSDAERALSFLERAKEEGHIIDGGSLNEWNLKRIQADVVFSKIKVGSKVNIDGRDEVCTVIWTHRETMEARVILPWGEGVYVSIHAAKPIQEEN